MNEVIETIHELRLFDVTDYDDEWEGFQPGDPVEGADDASEKLVTVRSLESLLDIEGDDFDSEPIRLEDADLSDRLESIQTTVNDLDDRRDELEDELREVEESLGSVEPFVELGIDLDLLQGYDHLTVIVGQGDRDEVRRALVDADDVEQYQLFGEGDTLAAFVTPADASVSDALVSAEFTQLEIPETDADPEGYVTALREQQTDLEDELADIEAELADLADDHAEFLLAAEERLTIDVQKREAPLSFATTRNAFVAEGWLPSEQYVDLADRLKDRVGDHVDIEEIEQAEYDEDGHAEEHNTEEAVAADGGHAEQPMSDGSPPVVQDNPGPVKPFESLVSVLNKPKYSELDPTIIFFLTFPLFFGFMIGDLGYGLIYMGLGYLMMRAFDSDIMRALGAVGLLSGFFTAIFGVLYGEFFGLHQLGYIVYPSGNPPMHKGLQPHYLKYGLAWMLLSAVAGVLHLVIGRVFDFVNNLKHGVGEAFIESGSWIIFTVSLWVWIFSHTALNAKPEFLYTSFASAGQTNPVTGDPIAASEIVYSLGFNGFSTIDVFAVGGIVIDAVLLVVVASLALIVKAEGGIGLVESVTQGFGHVISYARIAAVLLAKAGMALAVNLLVFGAYAHDGEFHLIFFASETEVAEAQAAGEVIFSGLVNGDGALALVLGVLAGILVLVLGHLLVLVLGVTSAGLQAVRLEYVEFFGKFYEGGGRDYTPFGQERRYTTDE
ncbi:MAG: V-type ATP synthase subunit I [Halobacteriales archaeon]|nr:V-type ATP synthase subunit I [Halobacteriales archaeon]